MLNWYNHHGFRILIAADRQKESDTFRRQTVTTIHNYPEEFDDRHACKFFTQQKYCFCNRWLKRQMKQKGKMKMKNKQMLADTIYHHFLAINSTRRKKNGEKRRNRANEYSAQAFHDIASIKSNNAICRCIYMNAVCNSACWCCCFMLFSVFLFFFFLCCS